LVHFTKIYFNKSSGNVTFFGGEQRERERERERERWKGRELRE